MDLLYEMVLNVQKFKTFFFNFEENNGRILQDMKLRFEGEKIETFFYFE